MPLISGPARAHRLDSFVFRLFLSTLLLLAASAATALAQGGVGSSRGLPSSSSGSNIIQGRVYFPFEPKEGKRLKVRLTSTDMMDQTTIMDEDGVFVFNGLPSGNYTIMVEGGREFDNYTEPVAFEREASVAGGRTRNVNINMRPKGAADAFNKIPKAARDLYAKGQESAAKGDGKTAVEHYNGAVTIYPQFSQALYEMGVQYLKLGRPDKAADAFQAALKITPDEPGLRLNYGIALLQQKKYPEAETELRAVLVKNDNLPTAHMYLGIALMSQQKFDDAEKELVRAISFKSAEVNMAHRYLGGVYWAKRDYPRAADELETYLKLVPKAADAERTRAAIKELRSKKAETPEKK
ncbi:MAG TPA: tetratricopeptide repeat protein [Pyrinomonadaceae bacterium]|jgi:Flp pilus assembly protein TadD